MAGDIKSPCKHFTASTHTCAYMQLPTEPRVQRAAAEVNGGNATPVCSRQFHNWFPGPDLRSMPCRIAAIEEQPWPGSPFLKQRELQAAASEVLSVLAEADACPNVGYSQVAGPNCKVFSPETPCLRVGRHADCPVAQIVARVLADGRNMGRADEIEASDAYDKMLTEVTGVKLPSDISDADRRLAARLRTQARGGGSPL